MIVALSELDALVGTSLGRSDWLTVDQKRIDTFADATDDHQWIHVDPQRAADRSPAFASCPAGLRSPSTRPSRPEGSDKPVCVAQPVFRFYA